MEQNQNPLISQFMSRLKNSQPPENTGGGSDKSQYIQTVNMGNRNYQGKLIGIPFLSSEGAFLFFNKTESSDNRVKEISMYLEGSDYESWVRVLPKEYYPELAVSPEDSALYDEVVSAFNFVRDAEYEDIDDSWLRLKNYGLLYMYLLQHNNTSNESLVGVERGTRQGASLVIIPSANASKTFDEAVKSTSLQAGGNSEWITSFYNNNPSDRIGYLTVSCFLSTTSVGYVTSFEHGTNSALFKVIPEGFVIPETETKKFGSMLRDFLGWKVVTESGLFNRSVFQQIKTHLTKIINAKGNFYNITAQGEQPAIGGQVSEAPAATPAPTLGAIDGMSAPTPVATSVPVATPPTPTPTTDGAVQQGFVAPPPPPSV